MTKDFKDKPLTHDWNKSEGFKFRHKKDLQLDDETLRDGLQSPSITDPTIEEKLELIELMEELGIDTARVGREIIVGIKNAGGHRGYRK